MGNRAEKMSGGRPREGVPKYFFWGPKCPKIEIQEEIHHFAGWEGGGEGHKN